MPSRILLALAVAAICGACGSTAARCGFADFSIGSSHMTNTIPTPFVVRELRGRFVPTFTDEAGAWLHQDATIAFQLNGPNGRRIRVPVALDGRFHVPHLPPGRYCFHTSSGYFQGHDGIIIIDPRAAESFVTIPVELAV